VSLVSTGEGISVPRCGQVAHQFG